MTTTTAKLPRLLPLAAALLVALPVHAQWRVTPSLSLTETYTDNVNLASDANKRAQFVTEATPGLSVYGQNSRVQLSANARASYFHYSNGRVAGTRTSTHSLNAAGKLKVIDELFYIDARASSSARAVSAFGPLDDEGNRFSDENRTDVTTWSVSPYLTQRFGNFAVATARYTHDRVKADDSRYGSSTSNGGMIDLASGRAWRELGWNLRYARQDVDNEQFGNTASENFLASSYYQLDRTLRLTASAGYDSYDYEAAAGRTAGASWSVGFAWAPSQRTSLEMSAGRHFLGSTGRLAASHRSRHSVLRLGYSDDVTTTRDRFAMPQLVDTFSLFDSLYAASIPDPVARRQAIDAYLLATGLPSTSVQYVNALTNRYFRQKLAQGSAAFNWRTHSAVLSAYASERNALSTEETGNIPADLFRFNDNLRQYGLNAAHSYRLNARTSATASLTASQSRALTGDFESSQQTLRLSLSRRFSRKVFGIAEVRRTTGERGFSGRDYTANAVSATLSVQL